MAHKALLIGINEYQDASRNLRGCVHDVEQVAELLVERFGFDSKDIDRLLNQDATTDRMRRRIRRLVEESKPGDVVVLHYSGHGSSVPDQDGDEEDMLDECLCPHDVSWNDAITDDWLRQQFDRLPEGVNCTVIMDCCHSGSNTRDSADPEAPVLHRHLPCPSELLPASGGKLKAARHRAQSKSGHRSISFLGAPAAPAQPKQADLRETEMPEVLLAGCRDYQLSEDALIDGQYSGAMTHSLVKTLRGESGSITYRELHARMMGSMADAHEQVPQLEGRRELLDRGFLAPPGEAERGSGVSGA